MKSDSPLVDVPKIDFSKIAQNITNEEDSEQVSFKLQTSRSFVETTNEQNDTPHLTSIISPRKRPFGSLDNMVNC